jgi:metal-responsive CopG/Arc/MetJ family transcriptional regulator
MSKSKMLSFRLDTSLLRKVDMLRISRHRTRGEIIREALELYFRAYNPTAESSVIPLYSATYIENRPDPFL